VNVPLVVIIVVATAGLVGAGLAFTFRGFKASDARATRPENSGQRPSDAAHPVSRHNPATDDLLKRFFDGKNCAVCKRPIPPVQRSGLKPGLLNPVTHQTHAWDQIPNENLAVMLEQELPVCNACQLAESFRQRFPDRVVDRDRSAAPSRASSS
jgi:hypothetical protein